MVNKKKFRIFNKKKNLLNMDTISVLSSSIKKNKHDIPINSITVLKKKLIFLKKLSN